jgi:acetoin utilization deacetylase AcuC-like enzyme
MLILRHDSSLRHDTGGHPESIARIAAINAALGDRDWLGADVRESSPVALQTLHAVHPEPYVDFVRATCEQGGGNLDADTVVSAGSYEAALHAAGGAVELVDALVAGEVRAGASLHRPPGHHAERAQAMGFCLFANVAVACQHALDAHGLERILVLDFDVHHGNGTNDIFHQSPEVLFASIHQSPLYPGTGPLSDVGSGDGEGYTINLPVPPYSDEDVWLSLAEHVVVPAAREYRPQLILVSAGFDAHASDPLAMCELQASSFAQMALQVRALAEELGVPYGAVLEGGYDLSALSQSVAATLAAFAEGGEPRSVEADDVTRRAAAVIGRHWSLDVPTASAG